KGSRGVPRRSFRSILSAMGGPAALALSIDCDGCTVERLHRVFRYWTGTGETEFGPGLGLPVASSMFAYSQNPSAPPQAAYLDGDRDGLLDAWRRGWIDSLHGLGDFGAGRPCTRELARRAFEALAADGVRLQVWTNHGGPENVQNMIRPGTIGDIPDSPCYLSDLAADYGIRYLWPSELTPWSARTGRRRRPSTTPPTRTGPAPPACWRGRPTGGATRSSARRASIPTRATAWSSAGSSATAAT